MNLRGYIQKYLCIYIKSIPTIKTNKKESMNFKETRKSISKSQEGEKGSKRQQKITVSKVK